MLRMSGRTRLVTKTISKLMFSMFFGCAIVLSLMFMKYKFVYSVKINDDNAGYVASRIALEKRIEDFIINGDSDNVGYVILNSKVDYELVLVNKEMPTSEEKIFASIKDKCDIFYKVYAVVVDDEEKALVESLEDAQSIIDEVNEKQADYKEQVTMEIEEKFMKEYEVTEDFEVAVNDIFEPIKTVNDAIREIKTAPARGTTVSNDVLIALKENLSELDFNVPVKNSIITSRFGWRTSGYHYGIDLAAPTGTDITAAEAGIVTYSAWCGNYGYLLRVKHSDGYETYYAHCSKLIAEVGDQVGQGDLIGKVGSTGRSTGPHLHMEVRYEGTPLNPEVFIFD